MSEDLLKQAKALRSSAFGTHKQALDVVDELIAEVERRRSDWRQEHATAETWKEDFKKMQKRLTDSELLRQAQYNQTAAKDARIKELSSEVERLRSENKIISDRAAHHEKQDAAEIELLAARIAELEAGKLMYEEREAAIDKLLSLLKPEARELYEKEQRRAGGKDEN